MSSAATAVKHHTAPPSTVDNLKRYKRGHVKSFLDSREKYD